MLQDDSESGGEGGRALDSGTWVVLVVGLVNASKVVCCACRVSGFLAGAGVAAEGVSIAPRHTSFTMAKLSALRSTRADPGSSLSGA